jgi:hypothetical protein
LPKTPIAYGKPLLGDRSVEANSLACNSKLILIFSSVWKSNNLVIPVSFVCITI